MIEKSVQLSECPGWLVKPRSRRIAEFHIADSTLLSLFRRSDLTWRVDHPLPDDARIVGVLYRVMPAVWAIYIESEMFAEVPEGRTPPMVSAPTLRVSVGAARPSEDGD